MISRLLNILLVEDDAVDVMNVRRAFARSHILNPIFVASDGVEALAMLRRGEVPRERLLVLLDLNLPRMNGIEFLCAVRQDPELSALSVVVLTTSNEDQDKAAAYNLHIAGYLVKPVTFSDFCQLLVALDKYWGLVEML
jgi:CheY-like chemotaxis protein